MAISGPGMLSVNHRHLHSLTLNHTLNPPSWVGKGNGGLIPEATGEQHRPQHLHGHEAVERTENETYSRCRQQLWGGCSRLARARGGASRTRSRLEYGACRRTSRPCTTRHAQAAATWSVRTLYTSTICPAAPGGTVRCPSASQGTRSAGTRSMAWRWRTASPRIRVT